MWENGETYDGEWYKGMRQGKGIWRGNNGESYDGEWRRGKAHGFGVHTWSNGDKYDGEWYRSLKHGKGKDTFHTGDSYEGEYRYGRFDGTGIFKWSKGMIYKGQFKHGMRQGKGLWMEHEDGSGANYNGEYYKDKKHGIGVYTWPSGNQYQGNYVNDKREGYGEMCWTDGSYYKGEWKDGIQHGKGKIVFADGVVKEGQFVNNMYVDSKNYQYTIDHEDKNELLNKSVYSHMPRANYTRMEDRDLSYIENQETQKRKYSFNGHRNNQYNSQTFDRKHQIYHSPEQDSTKFNIEKVNDNRDNHMSFTTPYKKRIKSNFNSYHGNNQFLPDIHSRDGLNQSVDYEREQQFESQRHRGNPYNSADEEYDSDYLGPRKPFMREDRSTSPPDHDPIFRRANQRSVAIQETDSRELMPRKPKTKQRQTPRKNRSKSKGKHLTPQKIKFSQNFMKKYPALFKGLKTKQTKDKHGKVLTVVYKPWVPSGRKFAYFDEIAHKYKVY